MESVYSLKREWHNQIHELCEDFDIVVTFRTCEVPSVSHFEPDHHPGKQQWQINVTNILLFSYFTFTLLKRYLNILFGHQPHWVTPCNYGGTETTCLCNWDITTSEGTGNFFWTGNHPWFFWLARISSWGGVSLRRGRKERLKELLRGFEVLLQVLLFQKDLRPTIEINENFNTVAQWEERLKDFFTKTPFLSVP